MRFVNNVLIGDDLVLNICVSTATSNVRVLNRVPEESRVPLPEKRSERLSDIFYNVENVTY